MKINFHFHSYANKTNLHMKNFALSLAFIMKLTATWKWPMTVVVIWKCYFLERGKPEYPEKLLEQRREPKTNATHMTASPGIKPGPSGPSCSKSG